MSDELIKKVQNGVIEQTKENAKSNKTNKNELGKDAFLQLLVTQMKYQDPLNPSSNTEYIAQLATFSQLEQMQNLGSITTNSQAFSLVGKNVIVKTQSESGQTFYTSGKVDFVNMSGGKTQMSVNGSIYSIDQLDSVIDDRYILEKGLPGVMEKTELEYDADKPKDVAFNVFMGEGDTVANDVKIMIDKTLLDSSMVKISKDTITIDKSVFDNAGNGKYKINILFNDPFLTVSENMITVTVKNSVEDGSFSNKPEDNIAPDETDPGAEGTDENN